MSKWPWPENPIRMTRSSPASFAAIASLTAPRIACAVSGAGMMPYVLANSTAASNTSFCV